MAVKEKSTTKNVVVITPPKMRRLMIEIIGDSPYVQSRFSEKAKAQMREKHLAGSQAKKSTKKESRNFDDEYKNCMYISQDGWKGIHAGAFRHAMISACRLVSFKMTLGKLSLTVESDGWDMYDAVPLVRIHGEPEKFETMVRIANTCDIRVRAMWKEWSANVRVSFDADQFSDLDVINLMQRAGMQVGIGEGRPDSKSSTGMGWGKFHVGEVVFINNDE